MRPIDPETHRLRGSFRRDRHGDGTTPPSAPPSFPADLLDESHRPAWTALLAALEAAAVPLAAADAYPLSRYLTMLHQWQHLRDLPTDGLDPASVSRLERRLLKVGDAMSRIERSFGVSPSSRKALHLKPASKTPAAATDTASAAFLRIIGNNPEPGA